MAEIMVRNGYILTMDGKDRRFPDGVVAIDAGGITAVGPASEIPPDPAARIIDARGGIILPGLINAHTHAAMTLLRGIADDLPLMTWLNEHIFPAEATLDADRVRAGTRLACAEMIRSGTTCFCDMYLFEGAVAEAARESGMRAVVGEVLYDFPSPSYGTIDKGFAHTRDLIERWADDPLITIAVEPHSPYLCAPDLLREAAALARSHKVPLVIHLSETVQEVETVRKTHGRTPVGHLAHLGILGPDLVAPHCVVLTDEDIRLLRDADVNVVHNPESNMKLASGVAPVPKLLDAGVRVALGTDGPSSNNDLDLFAEMDTAAKLHKVTTLDPTVLDATTVPRMATIDGARALGLDHLTGSLEPGKRADLIIIDTDAPHLTPIYHPDSHLVYAARGSDVVTSMVNGRILMEDRRLTTIDEAAVMERAKEIAEEIRQSINTDRD